jgi:YesN/AraC family two-component response regulator
MAESGNNNYLQEDSIVSYRLVIIDDEKEISSGFAQFFPWKEIGFTVAGQFAGAKSALQYIMHNPVDVVVSDVIMPGMSGIDLARELAGTKLVPQPLVLLFSAHDEFEYAREALRYRCTDYILKSAGYDELVGIFRRLKERIDTERKAASDEADGRDKIIAVIKDYIEKNPAVADLETASLLVYLSPAYVSRYFKQKTSMSFSEYLMRVRMELAGARLADLQYRIRDISAMLGYTNPENFARSFKKFYGISPREYRFEKLGRCHPGDGEKK